jgi:hypothetical protein
MWVIYIVIVALGGWPLTIYSGYSVDYSFSGVVAQILLLWVLDKLFMFWLCLRQFMGGISTTTIQSKSAIFYNSSDLFHSAFAL